MLSGPTSASFADQIKRFALECPRFWLPRGSAPDLSEDGFLRDGRSFVAAAAHVPFEALAEIPVLALLGEPGMGKSTVLEQQARKMQAAVDAAGDHFLHADLSACGTDILVCREIFESAEFAAWKVGSNRLYLLIDGLDTCLQHVETLVALLLKHFGPVSRDRLWLRIGCRTTDWPADLERGLKELWGDEEFQAYDLAPLRRTDVAAAAVAVGCEPDDFLGDVDRLAASQFANRPVALGFLLKSRMAGHPMPERRADLYREGCHLLCDEPRDDLRRSARRQTLSAGQRLAIARRLAATTIFCQKTAMWTGPLRELPPQPDIPIDELLGGEEQYDRQTVVVSQHAIQETLDTGLFRSLGPHRIAFGHETYAELLAAEYLVARKTAVLDILELVLHPASGKVVPQLRETAAWLAALNRDVGEALIVKDPATFFASDTAPVSAKERQSLVRMVLKLFDDEKLHDIRLVRPAAGRLGYAGVEEDLAPFIREEWRSELSRRAAVLLAEFTHTTGLQQDLVRLALDEDGPPKLRVAAARAVKEIGDASSRAALRPLAASSDRDDDDELKGNALFATWPDHLTADELFENLMPPKRYEFIGAYRQFLSSDFAKAVRPHERIRALEWAETKITRSVKIDPLGVAALRIVTTGIDWFEDTTICDLLAKVVVKIAVTSIPHLPLMAAMNSQPKARAAIARASMKASPDEWAAHSLLSYGVVQESDLPLCLNDLQAASSAELQEKLAFFIAAILARASSFDTDIFDRAFEEAKRNAILARALQPVLGVTLGSERADLLKASYLARISEQKPAEVAETPHLGDLLADFEDGRLSAFIDICHVMESAFGDPSAGEVFPGWSHLDLPVRTRLLRTARRYLLEWCVQKDVWIDTGPWQYDVLYGYWAMRLVAGVEPEDLNTLAPDVWRSWMSSVFGHSYMREEPDEIHVAILKTAYRNDPGRFRELLAAFIDAQSASAPEVFILDRLPPVWDTEIAGLLLTKLRKGGLSPRAYRSALAILLATGNMEAASIAAEVITATAGAVENQIAIEGALGWLENDPSGAWAIIWPVLDGNYEFARCVFSPFARDPFSSISAQVIKGLQEKQLAQWFIWLANKIGDFLDATGMEEPPRTGLSASMSALGGWQSLRAEVMNELIRRGTPAAVAAIQYIDEAAPDVSLKRIAELAQDFVSQRTWKPLSPAELFEYVAGSHRPLASPVEVRADPRKGERNVQPAEADFDKDERCRFKKSGDSWTLYFENKAVSVKHLVGMAYIAHLLRSPGRSFNCAELQASERTNGESGRGKRIHGARKIQIEAHPALDEEEIRNLGATGSFCDEILDKTARREYRDRLEVIDSELAEAEKNSDGGRREQLLSEKQILIDQINAATRLRGRIREFANVKEHARKAVSKAIGDAIKGIKKHHPGFAAHLKANIHRGEVCYYLADGIAWDV
jgi:hypothetical protein